MSTKQVLALLFTFAAFSLAGTFPNVDYLFKAEGSDRIEVIRGNLSFGSAARKLSFASPTNNFDIPADSVTSISYERASKPRYASGILRPVPFTKSKYYYLTIQYNEERAARYAFFRLHRQNYRQVIAAAEAATGKLAKREKER